jgi:adenosylcobinamide-phosphate synthase
LNGIALLAGWTADLVAGDPRRGHPVAGFGRLALLAERALWRDQRAAGVAYAALCAGVPTGVAFAADRALARRGTRAAGITRAGLLAALTWAAIGGRSLGREADGIAGAVADGDLDLARKRLPALVGRDPAGLDGPEICRAVCESVAENTADAVVGPLVWGAVAGPAGVVAYRCANTLDAMVGHHSPRYERFGWASARLDDVLTWVPARLAALLAAACAPLAGGSAAGAVAVTRRDGANHPSPNAGRVEAAFAGALGLRLGGVNHYGARTEIRGPLGDGAAPDPGAVRRAARLSTLIGAATALLAAGAARTDCKATALLAAGAARTDCKATALLAAGAARATGRIR